jgi:hypothetical protein
MRHFENIVKDTAEIDKAAAEVREEETAGMTCPNKPGLGPPFGAESKE